MDLFTIFLVLCMATLGSSRPHSGAVFSVMDFGAVGDGRTDDSQAFIKAWKAVCGAGSRNPTFQVPWGKTFLLKSTKFEGPCKPSNIHIQIDGNLVAPSEPSTWNRQDSYRWLEFSNLNNFVVDGHGQIDGRGSKWWQACGFAKDCMRPTALTFQSCSNFLVRGLMHKNSQRNHISLANCNDATLSDLFITAPDESPNTDGIDLSDCKNIEIKDSKIGTGDDCIAINTGCSFINITRVVCGPGHGISIGSLGIDQTKAEVEEIHVRNCTLSSTQNGVRIKSWQGGSGFARKISFEDIILKASDNPIIIDQFYCPHATCNNHTSAVKISDISYTRVRGTSIRENAITFSCSEAVGCTNLQLSHINIMPAPSLNEKTYSSCTNAHGNVVDANPRVDCLLRN